jgi:hypothetical protein
MDECFFGWNQPFLIQRIFKLFCAGNTKKAVPTWQKFPIQWFVQTEVHVLFSYTIRVNRFEKLQFGDYNAKLVYVCDGQTGHWPFQDRTANVNKMGF